MSNVSLFVGLDYSDNAVQLCAIDQAGEVVVNRSCRNDWRELVKAVEGKGEVKRAAIEACGGSADLAEELVRHAGWHTELGHPLYVSKLRGSPDKSDYSDSRLIADLTRVGYLPRVWLAPAKIRELRQLVNHRQRLVDRGRAIKLQVGGILREQRVKISSDRGSRWSKSWIASVRDNQQLSEHARWIVNDLLDDLTYTDGKIARTQRQLRQATSGDQVIIKLKEQQGIGDVTAWVLRAYVGDFSRFKTAKQLARYCGMSPCNASSGKRQADAGLIDGCNKLLRLTVVQAAHRLIRTCQRWSDLAESMRARGKPACVIVGAVGNRWLRNLHHAMKMDAQPTDQKGAIGN